jgi:ketosteroid isomerase-like protein
MSQQNIQAVRRIHEAFGRGDMSAVLAEFDPQIVVHQAEIVVHQAESLPFGEISQGHDGFTESMTKLAATWESTHFRAEAFLGDDNKVFMLNRFEGRSKNGKTVNMPMVEIFTFRDGKVITLEIYYWDTAAVLNALQG